MKIIPTPPNVVERAVAYAATCHMGQKHYEAGTPYLRHPLRIMEACYRTGQDEVNCAAAVLHDVIEATDTPMSELRGIVGSEVAEVVDHLTRRDGETYAGYIQRVAHHPRAARIKILDLQDNLERCKQQPCGEDTMSPAKRAVRYTAALKYLLKVVVLQNGRVPVDDTVETIWQIHSKWSSASQPPRLGSPSSCKDS